MQFKYSDIRPRFSGNTIDDSLVVDERKEKLSRKALMMIRKGFRRSWWHQLAVNRSESNGAISTDGSSYTSDNLFIESINSQTWMELGRPCQPAYSTDLNEMKSTIASLLSFRLEKLSDSRYSSASKSSNYNMTEFVNNTCDMAKFVARICDLYLINDYHNFHHAYHVTMSMNKLVEMMMANGSILHDDYLAHFALVFSALVHDVGHKGVPNFILIKLEDELADIYSKTSILEKNSLKVAFDILNEECFSSLRKEMYGADYTDQAKFENIAKDTILCTDIFNAGRMAIAKDRWEKAYVSNEDAQCESFIHDPAVESSFDLNEIEIDKICIFPRESNLQCLQKTSAMEHLIQVADVAHNFQSWEVFIKWNYRLVKELYTCHESGLMDDVTATWNDGQQNFTDTYILPLLSRVQKMNILSEDEYEKINEAVENIRQKWKVHGAEICSIMQYGVKVGEKEEFVVGKILNNKIALTA